MMQNTIRDYEDTIDGLKKLIKKQDTQIQEGLCNFQKDLQNYHKETTKAKEATRMAIITQLKNIEAVRRNIYGILDG